MPDRVQPRSQRTLDAVCQHLIQQALDSAQQRVDLVHRLQQMLFVGLRSLSCFLQRAQRQVGIADHQLFGRSVSLAPQLVQLTDLAGGELRAFELLGQFLGILLVGARQHQKVLHDGICLQVPLVHHILEPARAVGDKAETSTRPALAASKTPGDIIQGQSVLVAQRLDAPPIFKR